MSEASATTGTAADPGLQQQASTIASADEDAVNASTSIDYLDLCRLCLQKDSVNLSIFEEEGEQRQMFLKISATLPVKIFKEDKLPKKICDDCSYKVELLYQFWNTAATSEKQLLQWLGEIGLDDKQNYEVLEEDLMKSEKGNDNRLNTNIIQVSDQNSIEISMIDNISLITIPAGSEQFTTVPIDASGTIQTEAMQSSHDQSQIEEDRSEMGDMSDDGCDNEGLPVKEESDDQNNQANMDQAYVSIEAGPSGIQHQKISELTIQQAADGDPKTGREKSAKAESKQKQKQRGRWTEAGMQAAVSAILAKKMTLRKASLYFAVPKSTLASRMKSIQAGEQVDLAPQIGSFQKALCQRLESQLIACLKEQEARFLPLHKREFLKLAYDLAEHLQLPHKFNKFNKTAGKKFYYDFTLRHPELSVIADPSLTSPKTSAPISKTQVDQFFKVYQELVDRHRLTPAQIHSCEETSVLIHHRDIRRNVNVCKLTPSERGTVLLSVNAAGDCFAPPLFVFPGHEALDESYRRNCPLGSVFSVEESGCVSTASFLEYLSVLVELQAPSEQRPLLLLVNARPYHNDLRVIHYARQHHVHLLGLPQHSAHILHPLERAVMQTFGAAYIEACKKWIKCCQPAQLAPRDVAGLVNEAYCSIFRKDLAQYAFRCTGLWPINPHAIVGLDYGDDMDDVFDDNIAPVAAVNDNLMSIPTVDVQQEQQQQQLASQQRTSCCSTTTSTTPSTTATTPTSPTLSDLFRSSTSSLQSYLPSASVIRRVDEAANEASTSSLDDFVLKAVESVAGFSVIRRIHSGEESNFDVNI